MEPNHWDSGQVGLEKYTKNDKNINFHLKKSNVLGPGGLVDGCKSHFKDCLHQ